MASPRRKLVRIKPQVHDCLAAQAWITGRSIAAVLAEVLTETFSATAYASLVESWNAAGRPPRRVGVRPN